MQIVTLIYLITLELTKHNHVYGYDKVKNHICKNMKGKKRINNTGKKLFMYQRYFSLL